MSLACSRGAAESVAVLGRLLDRYPASQLGEDEWRAPRAVGVAYRACGAARVRCELSHTRCT